MLLLLALTASSLAAGLPDLDLSWKRGAGALSLVPPTGEHLAPDAPVAGHVAVAAAGGELRTDFALPGAALARGLTFPIDDGLLTGQLRVSLCEDAGTTCRWAEVRFSGQVGGAKGRLLLEGQVPPVVPPPAPPPQPGEEYVGDPDAAFVDALARARATGGTVLLDFGAVWCPPCNLMAAEVLHDPADAAALDGMVVLAIDADRPDSWTLKDRYAVGGYPTLVAVDADGQELSRQVGYAGEDALLAWLGDVRAGASVPMGTPGERAQAAWILAARGEDDAAKALLGDATDGLDLRRARVMVAPTVEDLDWLLEREDDVAAFLTWIWGAEELIAEDDKRRTLRLRATLVRLMAKATPVQNADLLYLAGAHAPDELAARASYTLGAAMLRAAMTGDPLHDRGHQSFLATLLRKGGDVDGAVAVLQAAADRWPDDFTFHYALGSLLQDEGREGARASARAAYDVAYGDNRLRAARLLAGLLLAAGETDRAVQIIDQTLAEVPAPPDGVDVRTPRYRKALSELRPTD